MLIHGCEDSIGNANTIYAVVACRHVAANHMIRTQIRLADEQAQALKALSNITGLSIAELVRRGLGPLVGHAAMNW